ncbi:hypothetical protein [Devosia sp. SL43]|uniref:hypothetical protein n=1 Tax=Devosia sp. SL43 TaxID=2806348 RepID=UPI001F3DF059|nr:hypothetical protein [Devosia sp. SL43]UJW85692.1 hypothetical protein IM737_20295 [Devosia sp. SL43]
MIEREGDALHEKRNNAVPLQGLPVEERRAVSANVAGPDRVHDEMEEPGLPQMSNAGSQGFIQNSHGIPQAKATKEISGDQLAVVVSLMLIPPPRSW